MSNNASCQTSVNIPVKTRPGCPNDKKALMLEIYRYGFMVDELVLYLDTHPQDQAALECFRDVRGRYMEAVQSYTKMYGPLMASFYEPDCKWTWNQGPMPWEGEV
jgi:spore coat protein JB